jgi:hypothetical protein
VCVKSIRIERDVDQKTLAFYTWCSTCKKYKEWNGTSIGSPLLFVRDVAHVKSIRNRMGHRSGAPYFLYMALCI